MHNLPLPKLGSFEFYLLQECISRERQEKIAFGRLLASLLGISAGVSATEITTFVEEYAEEVLQLKYNYKYETVVSRLIKSRKEEVQSDRVTLDRVKTFSE